MPMMIGQHTSRKKQHTMAYEKGTKIRVRITSATVGRRQGGQTGDNLFNTTTSVAEPGPGYWTHYLYLDSGSVTGNKTEYGIVNAEFDATVTGEFGRGLSGTTQVTEVGSGLIHYLFLGSESVTVLEDEKPEVKAEAKVDKRGLKKGARIRVEFTGKVGSRRGEASTTLVEERGGGPNHFIFLASDRVTSATGSIRRGDTVTVAFDGEVGGDYGANELLTTMVREVRANGSYGYTHYLFLNTDSVTVLEDEKPTEKKLEDAAPRNVGGTRITPGDEVIESADVLKRIAELEGARPAFTITRARTGELVRGGPSFRTREAALEYLDDLDFNPARFTITPDKSLLSADDQEELRNLKALNEAGRELFGSSAWITNSVQLRSDDACNENWARERAVEKLGISSYQLEEWPLDLVDWSEAANSLLESEYLTIEFGTIIYWGKDTE